MSKPKIDLKARLGRRPGAPPASASIPPPVGVNPPHGSGAPVSHSSGFPASGGYAPPQQQVRPSFDPMSAPVVSAPAMRAAPALDININDAELVAVQKGNRSKAIVVAAATAVVGGVLGFAVGGLSERNAVAEAAVVGAKALSAEIDAANASVVKLNDVLTSAAKTLKEGKYPESEVKELGGINIPFDGTNLAGKSIGRFKPQLITMLISYAEAASKANTQKDRIRNVLGHSKEGVEELLAQNTNPRVHWGVSIQNGPQGPWGTMQVLPTAFPVNEKGGWPGTFEIPAGDQKTSVKRYTGGDPTRGDAQLIPIAPGTQNSVCPTDTMIRLRRELTDIQKVLNGDETPGQEVTGIVQLGDTIKKQLAGIGG